jgi:signal transduction histidine kinase
MNPLKSVGFKVSVLTSFFVLLVIGLMARWIFLGVEEGLIGEMSVRAEFFARSSKEALFPKVDPFSLHFQVEQMLRERAVTYAAVLDGQGKVLSHSKPSLIGETLADAFTRRALATDGVVLQRYDARPGLAYDLAAPIMVGARRVGTARLGFNESSLQAALRGPRRRIALTAAAGVGFAILGTILIVGWIMRPLPKLAAAAYEVGKGNFKVKVDIKSNDEIGMLARAFNDMTIANAVLFTAIEQEKEKLSKVVHGTREGLVWTDPGGRVLLINPAARALLDCERRAVDTIETVADAAGMTATPAIGSLLAGSPNVTPFELERAKPKQLVLAGVAERLGTPADPAGFLFIFHDATLEKRGETLTRSFLSLMSHKLRTPLAVALGYLEILQGDKDLKPFHQTALGKIRGEDEKLREIVEKLLAYCGAQSADSIMLQPVETSIAQVISEALKNKQAALEGVEVTWDAEAAAGAPKVKVDAQLIRQALESLVENAVKFNRSKPKKVSIAAAKVGATLRVAVSDNGVGIPSEEAPKLFRKFYQIDPDFTGQIPGLGLGLAFVKNVVEAHKGQVGLMSEPGKGSDFWITLPL